jgi:uncharacterized phage protein (TIGR02218 family)
MTFEAEEESKERGSPFELYEFMVYGRVLRFTTEPQDVENDGKLYTTAPIRRSEFEETGELSRNDITLTTARDFPVSEFFRVSPPSEVILLTIWEVHRHDAMSEAVVVWSGRVLNVTKRGLQATFECQNVFTSLLQPGLRRTYGRMCPHVLYGPSCKAPEEDFKFTADVTDVDGLQIQAGAFAGFDDGRLAGGFLEWEALPGQIEKRGIKAHEGSSIYLTHAIEGLGGGATVTAAPGCAHDPEDCTVFFSNYPNYGGFPDVPTKNPFGTNSIFQKDS